MNLLLILAEFSEIFRGTIHIFFFYIIILIICVILLLFSKIFDDFIEKLKKITVSKDDTIFKLNYLAIIILITITIISIIIIGFYLGVKTKV